MLISRNNIEFKAVVDNVFNSVWGNIPDTVPDMLDSFANLPVGWDYGEGGPIDPDVLNLAKLWYDLIVSMGLERRNAFPGIDAVTLTARSGDHRIEVIIKKVDGQLTFGFAHDVNKKQRFYRKNLTADALMSAFVLAMGEIWKARTLSTRANTIGTAASSSGKLSATIEVGSQSSNLHVLNGETVLYANILPCTIVSSPTSLATLPYSGVSILPGYLLAVR